VASNLEYRAAKREFPSSDIPELEGWEDFLAGEESSSETPSVPDAQAHTEPSTQRQEELRKEAQEVQRRVDNQPKDFLTDSTPDMSRQET
jgi:hypothetical protein